LVLLVPAAAAASVSTAAIIIRCQYRWSGHRCHAAIRLWVGYVNIEVIVGIERSAFV